MCRGEPKRGGSKFEKSVGTCEARGGVRGYEVLFPSLLGEKRERNIVGEGAGEDVGETRRVGEGF
jgi:hypothetical protein